MKRGRGGINVYQNKITIIIEGLYRTHNVFYKYNSVDFCLQVLRIRHFVSFWIKLRQFTFFIKPPWRNWLARSAVNRKVGGSSPPGGVILNFFSPKPCLSFAYNQKQLLVRVFSPASMASREVTNLPEKNAHTLVYGVKELDTLSLWALLFKLTQDWQNRMLTFFGGNRCK